MFGLVWFCFVCLFGWLVGWLFGCVVGCLFVCLFVYLLVVVAASLALFLLAMLIFCPALFDLFFGTLGYLLGVFIYIICFCSDPCVFWERGQSQLTTIFGKGSNFQQFVSFMLGILSKPQVPCLFYQTALDRCVFFVRVETGPLRGLACHPICQSDK